MKRNKEDVLINNIMKLQYKIFNQEIYLKFIPITKKRLKKSIDLINNKNLSYIYNKYIFK